MEAARWVVLTLSLHDALPISLDGWIQRRSRRKRKPENAPAMVILDERIKSGFAVARAGGKNGEFAGEGHEPFEDECDVGKLGLGFGNIVCGAQNPLAFAVVAHARCLEHRGKAELFARGVT